MRLIYSAFVRLPTEKAHGLQIMKVCEALAHSGAEVELVIPGRKTHLKEDPFAYYNVQRNFVINTQKVPDGALYGKVWFLLSEILLGIRLLWTQSDFLLSQDEWVLLVPAIFGRRIVYEVHSGRTNIAARFVAKRSVLMVANSHGTKRFYVERGTRESKILVCPNGVDVSRFDIPESMEEAREKLQLPKERKIILYTGHLYDWKGVNTLAQSAKYLPEALFVFVGGVKKDIEAFKEKYATQKNILILGHKPYADIPLYLRAADILALPNDRIGESEQFTSPMKLFEYMAAGKPVVASNLPSVHEVLSESSAFFFESGSVTSLTQVVSHVLNNPEKATEHALRAKKEVKNYDWNRQAIVDYLVMTKRNTRT